MAEYIKREAVLARINKTKLPLHRKLYLDGLADAIGVIKAAPAAEVAPVVFCRNCKHRGTDECPMYYEETVSWVNKELMPEWDVIKHDSTRDDGFCDRGDRKDGE